MTTLGIETSCDETALALLQTRGSGETFEYRIIQSLVHSQANLHSAYGGVFPTLAKREHGKNILPLLDKLLLEAQPYFKEKRYAKDYKKTLDLFEKELSEQNPDLWQSILGADFLVNIPRIDQIAVTQGPGLEPALWVGISLGRFLSTLWNIPLIAVDHMEGHIIGSLIDEDKPYGVWQYLKGVTYPAIALLISGGHTELVEINSLGDYKIIGQTRDDAVGEAFDKVARLLGLPYPGGPHLSRLAEEARQQNILSPIKLPRPMIDRDNHDFSFSGLKTAVLYAIKKAEKSGKYDNVFRAGLALEFENAVTDTLSAKSAEAIEKIQAKTLIMGGGVSANHSLRRRFTDISAEYGIPLYMPSFHLSGDNALMIALVGALNNAPTDSRNIQAQGTKKLGKNLLL
ncbi:MAG: hypothetical protein A3B11_02370 [Candidatus Taylorbacteria bacterium RIFCSPLOWO2_01_FULL_44_26]|uniref:tRNA N6-adenosine threonylcarbamoyltransferase n=2 Tax=Candidatus Tayloriibacteriota TaxID=1817919 RepID=A0A1G2MK44_9BACT|nr:MAG: hypothetical protein A3D50_01410 [Candidatus Taylorbacteria bacterium RIFCSPHIGHO2_02_FULL_44_12]OHA30807.1 MAG: hypothetical protein A3B11_02370 [Candidatus Taylorbacteria bacterium RIFCSPLOWO2_01_FULL_44_26]